MSKKKLIAVIPAHLASVRFPNKILHDICGIPMVEHVRRRALLANVFDRVIVATCDQKIKDTLEPFGADVVMTSNRHKNGSSRVFEVSQSVEGDFYCLLQGDEPTLPPFEIKKFINSIDKSLHQNVWNAVASLDHEKDLDNPSFVKAILSESLNIHYCFRRSLSHQSFNVQQSYIYKILGLVCFSKDALKLFHQKNQSIIERYESIEQIRLLELNLNVQGVLLNQPYPSINEPSDEEEVLSFLMRSDNLRDLNRVLNFDK